MTYEGNNYGRDYLSYSEKPTKNFTTGFSKDGIEYTTASFSLDHLEVSFKNGTINIYDANDMYWDWYYLNYYKNSYPYGWGNDHPYEYGYANSSNSTNSTNSSYPITGGNHPYEYGYANSSNSSNSS